MTIGAHRGRTASPRPMPLATTPLCRLQARDPIPEWGGGALLHDVSHLEEAPPGFCHDDHNDSLLDWLKKIWDELLQQITSTKTYVPGQHPGRLFSRYFLEDRALRGRTPF